MSVISIANQKGGVGKSTTSQALIEILNSQNKKTLAIDLDPQSNLTFAFKADSNNSSIYNVLKSEINISDAIQKTEICDILPSNIFLSGADIEFNSTGREYLLKESLNHVKKNYKHIIIDCPPALSILTINAFAASDYIIIPVLPDIFSIQGLSQLNNTIKSIKKYCNPNLKTAGILLVKFNERIKLGNQIKESLENLSKNLDTKLFEVAIRENVAIREAQLQRLGLLEYCESSNAMIDYKELIKELEEIINV